MIDHNIILKNVTKLIRFLSFRIRFYPFKTEAQKVAGDMHSIKLLISVINFCIPKEICRFGINPCILYMCVLVLTRGGGGDTFVCVFVWGRELQPGLCLCLSSKLFKSHNN